MGEIDLTAAVEAATSAVHDEIGSPWPGACLDEDHRRAAEAAVRAAAPIIERAVREQLAERLRMEQTGTDGGFYDGVSVAISIVGEATDV